MLLLSSEGGGWLGGVEVEGVLNRIVYTSIDPPCATRRIDASMEKNERTSTMGDGRTTAVGEEGGGWRSKGSTPCPCRRSNISPTYYHGNRQPFDLFDHE